MNNTGLIEVPMGITLREIIYDIGGGVADGKTFKAVQTGGPLGGCLPESGLDLKVDFDSLRQAGAVMGSGGMIVVDEDTCMVEFSKYFLTFATAESCGKCVPCRVGGRRMLELLTRISEGEGTMEDIDDDRGDRRGHGVGLAVRSGPAHARPRLSALRYFRDEFEAHMLEHRCPAKQCTRSDLILHRSECLQGLWHLQAGLPGAGDRGRPSDDPHHQPGGLHQVRYLPGGLPVRLDRQALGRDGRGAHRAHARLGPSASDDRRALRRSMARYEQRGAREDWDLLSSREVTRVC